MEQLEEVSLTEFKRKAFKIFDELGVDKIRVRSGRSSLYLNVYLHDEKDDYFDRDGDVLIDKMGNRFQECRLCGSIHNIKYVVPYDGSKTPGAYCYNCRRKHSIMDIKDAKRYGKVL